MPQQYINSKLLLSCSLVLSLILTANTAIATYKPPERPSRPKTATGSNSSRTNECSGSPNISLTALAPFSHVGQTASLQPTFAWFAPNAQGREIEFSLYEYVDGKVKLIYKTQTQSSPGIIKFSLADKKISLTVGNKYLWQVALLCNPNHPSEDLLVRAEVEVVEMPISFKNALLRTKEIPQRSKLYAEQGLWYDALAETLMNSVNKASTLNLLLELSKLELEETNKITEPTRKKDLEQQASRLQQVVTVEKVLK
ncbi:DUF928 domain-containing protein [Aulosira sp. FACHB-615]|uniref:DUF928 domain-containing protein n=1 Tax=Aulosira sp. FACHB-615 TaxID=2692777 RepID=UPI001687CAF8|nr:DUF928 domain-containing protein [Aulosira sp. FACHB-615]MBD2491233.1 DUF928 domain-containing protein [Aulosira sp. FACHB-615]